MTTKVISLAALPGIQRDGTQFASTKYVDGMWVRFQRGLPRKIGGFVGAFQNVPEISRGMVNQSSAGLNYVYSGGASQLVAYQTGNQDGVGFGPTNITLNNFSSNANNLWQFDIGFDPNGTGNLNLIAHPGQNLSAIDSTVNTPVLLGQFPYGTLSKVGTFTVTGNITNATTIVINSANYKIANGQLVTASGGIIPSNCLVISASVASNVTTVTTTGGMTITSNASITFDNRLAVSGGACMLYPYLFIYGNNGLIQNSSAGDFTNWVSSDSNANNISSTKVVKGLPLRGGTTSPAGLFWSLDQLTRVTYAPQTVGSSTLYWRYDIISTQTSIMSSSCVIEYDGIYYWIGVDRFLMYNGVVQEIPNGVNQNYFFDNLNFVQRQKVWVSKVPRFGEIWWFYPSGSSTECNNAIIYNVREQTWYDAGFAVGANRSAGTFSEVFKYPIWADSQVYSNNKYTLWQHETGTNQIYAKNVDAIQSYFETPHLGNLTGLVGSQQAAGLNVWTRLERVEPDFVQSGSMNLYVKGKGYADDVNVTSQLSPYVYDSSTLKIDMKEQYREMRLRFESNTFDGDYQMGNIVLSVDIGDVRGTGNP